VRPNVIEQLIDPAPGSPVAEAMAARAALMQASQANYDAVLTPQDPGGLPQPLRFALAARVARLGGDAQLAAHYAAGGALPETDASWQAAAMTAVLRHVDLIATTPRDATAADIAALQAAGVTTGDIVRLSQLIAFVSYQLRLIAGLRLMGATP
jgi:uncharacterized protein YciW